MLKSTILSIAALVFLFVIWAVTPVRADCPHKENFNHKHCDNVPTESSARVYNSADISIPDGATTTLNFNMERWDDEGIHDPAVDTSRLTAQTEGKYYIFAHITWGSSGVGGGRTLGIILTDIDGTTVIAEEGHVAGSTSSMSVSTHYELNVGDYVEVQVRQDSGAPILDVLNVEASSPEFGMVKLP